MRERARPALSPGRRSFLEQLLAAAGSLMFARSDAQESPAGSRMDGGNPTLRFGPPRQFSFEQLQARARQMASQPYLPPRSPDRGILEQIDYDEHGRLKFDTRAALFADGPGRYPVTFFHLGRYFQTPVQMYVVSDGAARELLYDPALFSMSAHSPAQSLGEHTGFAGFRFQESRFADQHPLDWQTHDWVAFLGAAYFRAIGDDFQYGLSARGIAIDVALADRPEEFPVFTEFFLEASADAKQAPLVYALLDGASVCGAFQFRIERASGVRMEVQAHVWLRRPVGRLGIAPLTSMYWYSEKSRRQGVDWRPEVHDSDGLALWTGFGERLWRPLNNPPRLMASAFSDRDPRGFGLLQRDRNFDNYLDGVHYERRPALWVEPLGHWGAGAVELIEIPTDDETHDNIVAMWVPAKTPLPGQELALRYRLHWQAAEPDPIPVARCVATRSGRGGEPGQPAPPGSVRFVVEFLGGPLTELPFGIIPDAVVSASRGEVSGAVAEPVPNGRPGHWRARFDLLAAGHEAIELRLYLRDRGEALSETWLHQFHPAGAV